VHAFERTALPALEKPAQDGVVLIDELGKMELASEVFREAVLRLFDSPLDIVATVHVFHDPLTAELKQRTDVERERVTHASRDGLPRQLAQRLLQSSARRGRSR
jgi:nucleoside-triphosphatase